MFLIFYLTSCSDPVRLWRKLSYERIFIMFLIFYLISCSDPVRLWRKLSYERILLILNLLSPDDSVGIPTLRRDYERI